MAVYKNYDQADLDRQYNNRLQVPGFEGYFHRWELQSRETEKKLLPLKDIRYGTLARERLDIFPSNIPHSKTFVFIHGGYWQMLDKSLFHFIPGSFQAYDITTVSINYPLAPEHSMDQIVQSCTNGMRWLYRHISTFNGDPDQIYVAGHSAGGHLAAMLLTTDWTRLGADLPERLIKGACLISGLFNLMPIQLSYLNLILKMDWETALLNSPVRSDLRNTCPVIVAVGEAETAEFNDQTNELYEAWKGKGQPVDLLTLPGENHFSVVDAIVERGSILHSRIKNMLAV